MLLYDESTYLYQVLATEILTLYNDSIEKPLEKCYDSSLTVSFPPYRKEAFHDSSN